MNWPVDRYNKRVLAALKKLVGVVVLVGILLGVAGPSLVYAQETRSVGGAAITPDDINAAINSPTPNLANTTAYIFYTISVIMYGTFHDFENPLAETSSLGPPQNLSAALKRQGMLGGIGFLTAQLIGNPPASFGYYAADIARHSRFGAQPVYAQGLGFGALSPILGTWNAFKNVAYYLLTIMFFITGFLILIRHKVSGNVAVTVQNALPRLVITLIVITFSYAIAGLIVDLMFLAIYFIINIFDTQIFESGATFKGLGSDVTLSQLALDTNIFKFTIQFIFGDKIGGGSAAWDAASSVSKIIFGALEGLPVIGTFTGAPVLGSIFEWIVQLIFTVIFAVALFIAMFRVFFALIMSYAGFVINVVLSPLILLEGAIPGRNPWTKWLKNLLAGLLPFVVVIFMIFMAYALTGVNTRPGIGYKDEGGQVKSGLRLPLIAGADLDADAFMGILAMGFMLLLPEAVKMAKEAVGAKGGPFDQYKDKITGALKQGWQGNQYVPGAKAITATMAGGAGLAALGGIQTGYAGARAGAKAGGKAGLPGRILGGISGAALGGLYGGVATPAGVIVGQTATAAGGKIMGALEKAGTGGTAKAFTSAVREQIAVIQERRPRSQISPTATAGETTAPTETKIPSPGTGTPPGVPKP